MYAPYETDRHTYRQTERRTKPVMRPMTAVAYNSMAKSIAATLWQNTVH